VIITRRLKCYKLEVGMNDGRDKNGEDEEKKRMTWGRLRLMMLMMVKE